MDGNRTNHRLQSLNDVAEAALIPPYSFLPRAGASIQSNSCDAMVRRVYSAAKLVVLRTSPMRIERWVFDLQFVQSHSVYEIFASTFDFCFCFFFHLIFAFPHCAAIHCMLWTGPDSSDVSPRIAIGTTTTICYRRPLNWRWSVTRAIYRKSRPSPKCRWSQQRWPPRQPPIHKPTAP